MRRDGHHAREKQGGQDDGAMEDVVDVEPVGVDGESGPHHPHGNEVSGDLQDLCKTQVVAERGTELQEGRDEDQIEEELDPAHALALAPMGGSVELGLVVPPASHAGDLPFLAPPVLHPPTYKGLGGIHLRYPTNVLEK
jgi:hypothetical protein